MIRTLLYTVIPSLLLAFTIPDTGLRVMENNSFEPGESLVYKVQWGPITAGKGTINIMDQIYNIEGRSCYKMEIYGETKGFTNMMYPVRDIWGTYMDTTALIPMRYYRYIKEGNYRRNEVVDFDHVSNKATTRLYEKKDPTKLRKTMVHEIPEFSQDMVSGIFYMRTLDFSNMQKGDQMVVSGFFDKEVFNLKFWFLGRETIKTKVGKVNAIRIAPEMPENKLFDGKNSLEVWLSDDENKVPLLIRAKIFIGHIDIELDEYKGLKHPLNLR